MHKITWINKQKLDYWSKNGFAKQNNNGTFSAIILIIRNCAVTKKNCLNKCELISIFISISFLLCRSFMTNDNPSFIYFSPSQFLFLKFDARKTISLVTLRAFLCRNYFDTFVLILFLQRQNVATMKMNWRKDCLAFLLLFLCLVLQKQTKSTKWSGGEDSNFFFLSGKDIWPFAVIVIPKGLISSNMPAAQMEGGFWGHELFAVIPELTNGNWCFLCNMKQQTPFA